MLTFKPTSKMWPSLEITPTSINVAVRRVVRCIELCPQALNRPDLHFEGVGNGPVDITWIRRDHELYSGAPPISLVEHCVTFRHDRRLLSLLGFAHNWPTSIWSAKKQKKKQTKKPPKKQTIKPVFIERKWNHVVFSRATILSFHPLYIYIYIYIYSDLNTETRSWCYNI